MPYWKGKTVFERTMAMLPEEAKETMRAMVFTCNYTLQKGTGHFLLNFEDVLQKGFNGICATAEESLNHLDLSNPDDLDKITFCHAVITVCEAAVCFSERYAEEAARLASEEEDGCRRQEL